MQSCPSSQPALNIIMTIQNEITIRQMFAIRYIGRRSSWSSCFNLEIFSIHFSFTSSWSCGKKNVGEYISTNVDTDWIINILVIVKMYTEENERRVKKHVQIIHSNFITYAYTVSRTSALTYWHFVPTNTEFIMVTIPYVENTNGKQFLLRYARFKHLKLLTTALTLPLEVWLSDRVIVFLATFAFSSSDTVSWIKKAKQYSEIFRIIYMYTWQYG